MPIELSFLYILDLGIGRLELTAGVRACHRRILDLLWQDGGRPSRHFEYALSYQAVYLCRVKEHGAYKLLSSWSASLAQPDQPVAGQASL